MSYNFITENLIVGDYTTAQNFNLLQNTLGITHIVSCGFDKGHFPTTPHCFRYFFIPINDAPNSNLLGYLPRAMHFIHNALEEEEEDDDDDDVSVYCRPSPRRHRVYVHCVHGQSRSCAVCIAYLMHCQYLVLQQQQQQQQQEDEDDDVLRRCYNTVQSLRPCMAVNPGFVQQLEIFRQMKVVVMQETQQQQQKKMTSSLSSSSSTTELPSSCTDMMKHLPTTTTRRSRAHATFRLFKARLEFYNSGHVETFGKHVLMTMPMEYPTGRRTRGEMYICRKCRDVLFTSLSVVLGGSCQDLRDNLPISEYWRDSAGGKEYYTAVTSMAKNDNYNGNRNETIDRLVLHDEESVLRVEPLKWMKRCMMKKKERKMQNCNEDDANDDDATSFDSRGTLTCKTCSQTLGYWDWCYSDIYSTIVILKSKIERV
jgi:hypothetical protein